MIWHKVHICDLCVHHEPHGCGVSKVHYKSIMFHKNHICNLCVFHDHELCECDFSSYELVNMISPKYHICSLCGLPEQFFLWRFNDFFAVNKFPQESHFNLRFSCTLRIWFLRASVLVKNFEHCSQSHLNSLGFFMIIAHMLLQYCNFFEISVTNITFENFVAYMNCMYKCVFSNNQMSQMIYHNSCICNI